MADNLNLKTGFVRHRGARIYFESVGAGPVVLLVHDDGSDMRLWDHVITPLTDAGFTALRCDLRGYGQSRGEGPPDHTADLLALLDAREAEQAVLVGCGLGAQVCEALAQAHPQRVSTLVLERDRQAVLAESFSQRLLAAL
ncbi:MAG: alpha/beta fold hydrolase [Chloroflexi bacterium]|nr:alpha/beta fold hydrolase [Chloroflexota bacterium]